MTLFGNPLSIMTIKDSCHCGSEPRDAEKGEGEARAFPDLLVPIDTASLWTTKEDADCVIVCGEKTFLAHMNILARKHVTEHRTIYSLFYIILM